MRNGRHRISNRRHHVRNRGDRIGVRGDEARVFLVLGVRAASLCLGACRAGGRLLAWLPARAQCARRAGGRLLAWLRGRARRPRYALNRLPHSVSNVADRAA